MKVLVIEDEQQVSSLIKQGLEEQFFSVDVAFDGYIGERLALSRTYDVIILDIVIPGINGFELCKIVKKERPHVPIIMLTTLGTTADKLTGFDAGADDYLLKPFEFEELTARLKVLMRRSSITTDYGNILRFEDLKVDIERKVAYRQNKIIKLSAKEFMLLEFFMRNPQRVISRSELAEKIWNIKFDTGTNVVEVYMNMLRNKIDRDFEPKLLQTRIGMGYVLQKRDMNIRTKLTVIFFGIVIIVLTVLCVSIYFFSANYRQEDFHRRLKNRAINTAKILTEVEEVNAQLLRRMERNNPASLTNQYVIIYNDNNEELYSSEGKKAIVVDTTLLNNIRLHNELQYEYQNLEVLGFKFIDHNDRFTIVAAATDVYGLDALQNLSRVLIIAFCISVVFVSILGWFYAGKALAPISKIIEEVANINEVSLGDRVNEGNQKDELNKLAQTFNKMLGRLQSAFASQKNFIANASHEIKTPITVMTGKIEVALLMDRDTEYYKQILGSVLGSLKTLNRLSTQLLLLAQTSTDQPEKNFTTFRIDDALWDVKDQLLKAFSEYRIDILFDLALDLECLVMEGDEELVMTAILNLMDNGCKYSDNHRVVITLDTSCKGFISLHFLNDGSGIDPNDAHKIFDPFFRVKHHQKAKGFGIGLSLVSQIAKLHRGEVTLESSPGQQTRFIITLPVSKQNSL